MNEKSQLGIFCENVRWLRAKHGLSKKEMAQALGIGTGSLTMIESGIVPKRLRCTVLVNIEERFGIDSSALLSRSFAEKM